MITLPPYISDGEAYLQLPVADRWFMNKLALAEVLSYNCGPVGTLPAAQGDFCVRPIMNISGMARGGFFKYSGWPFDSESVAPNPAYFWCEWFDGDHNFTAFIDDVAVYNALGTHVRSGTNWQMTEDIALTGAVALPPELQGISKYMYVESIGGNIIEASPRHSPTSVRQRVVNDYVANHDPSYTVDNPLYGIVEMELRLSRHGGNEWVLDESTRRPFTVDP